MRSKAPEPRVFGDVGDPFFEELAEVLAETGGLRVHRLATARSDVPLSGSLNLELALLGDDLPADDALRVRLRDANRDRVAFRGRQRALQRGTRLDRLVVRAIDAGAGNRLPGSKANRIAAARAAAAPPRSADHRRHSSPLVRTG